MPAGISKAKGRRNSKSRRQPGFQAYPAKAGKRKVYTTTSNRKVKSFSDGSRGFIMKDRQPDGLVFKKEWRKGDPVMVERHEN